MGSGNNFGDMNFDPSSGTADASLTEIAEQSIVNTIMERSIEEMSDKCLRFVRYLLSISRAARFGFLPNFSDTDAVREIARQFIRYSGSAAVALYTMNQVLEGEAYGS